jgi:hypothetical protein
MRDSQYFNAVYPSAASFPTQDADCCNSATGAASAATAQEHRTEALAAAGAGVVSSGPTAPKRGRGGCRCWWFALAAVVVIAVVAKS